MKELGIICLLPDKVKNYHLELRQKIEKEFSCNGVATPKAPAHVTIKYRFPVENFDEVEQAVQEFSTSQVKTKWHLKDFGYFENG